MAKNLFEQFLSFASSKLAGPIAHENIYRDEEPSELSSVAKYLARQEQAAKAAEAPTSSAAATGVEKYLARQAQVAPEAASAPAAEPATGVAKYLARQGTAPQTAAPKPAPAPAPVPTTGVGKYLASQGGAGSYKAEIPKASAAPVKKAEAAKAKAAPVKAAAALKPAAVEPAKETPEAAKPKPASSVIHLDDGLQCQASTGKGIQCKKTTKLSHIQRTINKQKYQFSVCSQHHNETFKPFPGILEQ